ncbi:MAG TPA: type I secretion system permease/ATPase [Rhizomicrobium sp.]|nr:type I secretion system permease/ATPase [Rhizomicrobium sp.]
MLIERLLQAGRNPGTPVLAALEQIRPLLSAAFLFSIVNGILALTVSFYMLQVYDRVLTSRSEETLLLLTLIAVVALAIFGLLDMLRARLLARAGLKFADALGSQTLRASVSTLLVTSDPSVRQGLRDVDSLRSFLAGPVTASLLDAPFLAVFLVLLLFLHWSYFVIVLVGGAALAAIALASDGATREPLTQALGAGIGAQCFADDGQRNADALEGLGMSATFANRWRAQWLESQRPGLIASDRDAAWASTAKVVRQLTQILLLAAGAVLVLDFQATGGVMIAASIIGGRALAPIDALVGARRHLTAVRLAHRRLSRLLEQAPAREDGMPLPAPTGRLTVENAAYLAADGRRLLANLNFALQPGEALCVIGPSGCGKSTLARLLVGARPCSAGVVRLDGADLHAWPSADRGRHVGYLPQDVELFTGTVRDNIARLTEADPEAVVRAAKRAHAHDMILALPQGYDTEIGEAGHRLSGGQRQRIGLARALFGDPCLVVLDEPNANLDSDGEEALLTAIAQMKARGTTVVLIAHRRSLLAGIDKILALQKGNMVLFGPRDLALNHMAQQAQRPQTAPMAEAAS